MADNALQSPLAYRSSLIQALNKTCPADVQTGAAPVKNLLVIAQPCAE